MKYITSLNFRIAREVANCSLKILGQVINLGENTINNTPAMKEAIDETKRRRSIQEAYNKEHGIVPKTIKKAVEDILEHQKEDAEQEANIKLEALKNSTNLFVTKQRKKLLDLMKKEMSEAADRLDYEQAAVLRDQIIEIEKTYGK